MKVLNAKPVSVAVSLLLGIAVGIFLHYNLYRVSIATQPFIYVAF